MKIMIDNIGYKKKPTSTQASGIVNRLLMHTAEHTEDISIDKLAEAIGAGRTIITDVLTGDKSSGKAYDKREHFAESSFVLLDIDNNQKMEINGNTQTVAADKPLSVDDIISISAAAGLKPCIICESFSSPTTDRNGTTYHKFHALFALDKPCTRAADKEAANRGLASIFGGYYDPSTKDIGRILYGTTPEKMVYIDNAAFNALESFTDHAKAQLMQDYSPNTANEYRAAEPRKTGTDIFNPDIALEFISATATRTEWLAVSCAYKNSGGSFSRWEQWSRAGNYDGKENLQAVWNSLTGEAGESTLVKRLKEQAPDYTAALYACYHNGAALPLHDEIPLPPEPPLYYQQGEYITNLAESEEITTMLQAEKYYYTGAAALENVLEFKEELHPIITTGFERLDKALDGGLYAGEIYTIGAHSGAGKTTFVNAIAMAAAKAGNAVCMFELEMKSRDIVSRMLSAIGCANALKNTGKTTAALTSKNILYKATREKQGLNKWSKQQEKAFEETVQEFSETIAPNIEISEGFAVQTVDYMRKQLADFRARHPKKPLLVIVDYLQVLQPADHTQTEKQAIDYNMKCINNMADEFDAAIILIQSLNRASQNSGNVGLTSGSGSGQIEYTTDNLFTIERAVLEHERDNNNKTKTKLKPTPDRDGFRYLSLEIVKSRFSESGKTIFFKWALAYNYFEEIDEHEITAAKST